MKRHIINFPLQLFITPLENLKQSWGIPLSELYVHTLLDRVVLIRIKSRPIHGYTSHLIEIQSFQKQLDSFLESTRVESVDESWLYYEAILTDALEIIENIPLYINKNATGVLGRVENATGSLTIQAWILLPTLVDLSALCHDCEDWAEVGALRLGHLTFDIFQISIFLIGFPGRF